MASSSIPTLLQDRKCAATLLLFISLSVFFVVFTRFTNPLYSFQLLPLPNPNHNPSLEQKNPTLEQKDSILEEKGPILEQKDSILEGKGPILEQKDPILEEKEPSLEGGVGVKWRVCGGGGAGAVDYIPCLDNWVAIKKLKSRRRMEHRERHCPEKGMRCLVPVPVGYRVRVPWPESRDMIWYNNVPHPKLVDFKKDQNWVRKSGDYFIFPGGGTQFKGGVSNYIQFIEKTLPTNKWGKRTRVILDVGCGVASFGAYLLDKDVLAVSFAPKDEHEAQIQFALERGIPALLSVIGTQRLTFPDNVFDVIHCARCRVHWYADGGKPLLELNRVLRPGGYFVWSATPVYRNNTRDTSDWNAMVALTESICWKTVAKSKDEYGIGVVIYQKPTSNSCYEERTENKPPICTQNEWPYNSWYTPLDSCLPRLPVSDKLIWPIDWPERLNSAPLSLSNLQSEGDIVDKYYEDRKYWNSLVLDFYMKDLVINWSSIRNVMDMNAGFGGFAAALSSSSKNQWVLNTVPVPGRDTLPVIFDRGLIGVYHDWCESFSTYPRTYDLLHSSFLLGNLTQRCDIVEVVVEMDRIVRPEGWIIVQDTQETIMKLHSLFRSLHWVTTIHKQQFLVGKKSFWRPR